MKDADINGILDEAARSTRAIDPALLQSVTNSIRPSLRPVRHLPTTTGLTAALLLVCAAVALAGASRAGFYGIEKMSLPERLLIFSTLAVLVWGTAIGFVNQMIPASRRSLSPSALLGTNCVALLALFASLFRDYHNERFFAAGVVCLFTGFLVAIPAGLLSWMVLRRGFAVDSVSAGLVAGVLAGLAGVGMLELHCANFQATHIVVWHTAVLPLTAAVGASVGWMLRLRTQ